jgi:hypothetical protein
VGIRENVVPPSPTDLRAAKGEEARIANGFAEWMLFM